MSDTIKDMQEIPGFVEMIESTTAAGNRVAKTGANVAKTLGKPLEAPEKFVLALAAATGAITEMARLVSNKSALSDKSIAANVLAFAALYVARSVQRSDIETGISVDYDISLLHAAHNDYCKLYDEDDSAIPLVASLSQSLVKAMVESAIENAVERTSAH